MTSGTHDAPAPRPRDERSCPRVRRDARRPRSRRRVGPTPGREHCSSSSLSAPAPPEWQQKGEGVGAGPGKNNPASEKRGDESNPIQAGARAGRELREGKPFRPNPVLSDHRVATREEERGEPARFKQGLSRLVSSRAIQLSPWEEEEGSPAAGRADAEVPGLRQGPRGRHRARQCAVSSCPPLIACAGVKAGIFSFSLLLFSVLAETLPFGC